MPEAGQLSRLPFVDPQLAGTGWNYRPVPASDPRPLPVTDRPLTLDIDVVGAGRTMSLAEFHAATASTSLLVLGRRRAAARVVRDGTRPRDEVSRRLGDQVGAVPPGRRGGPDWRTGSGRPGRAARARAGGHRIRRGAGAPPAQHDQRRGLGRGPPGPVRARQRAGRGVPGRRVLAGGPGRGRPTVRSRARATSTARPTPRCSTGCANARAAPVPPARGPSLVGPGLHRDAAVAVDGEGWRWPAAGWPRPLEDWAAARGCCSSRHGDDGTRCSTPTGSAILTPDAAVAAARPAARARSPRTPGSATTGGRWTSAATG